MNALHDFAYTCFDARLISKIRDVLALLSNDDTSFLCGDESAESDLRCSIFLIGGDFSVFLGDNFIHGSFSRWFCICGHPDSGGTEEKCIDYAGKGRSTHGEEGEEMCRLRRRGEREGRKGWRGGGEG
jgi:hypothetical protein